MKIKSCEDCKYEIEDGCKLGLIEKLGTAVDENGDVSLCKICMFKNKDIDEIDIKMGYIFILKDLSKIDTLKENIELIKDKNPLWIGISHDFPDNNDDIINIVKDYNVKYNIISNYEPIQDLYRLDQFKKNYKNGWTLVNIIGDYFNKDAKSIVQDYILVQLKSVGIIKDNKDIEDYSVNNVCFYNLIYKYLKCNDPEIDEENEVIHYKSIFQKLHDSNSSMFKTWEEVK